MKAYWLRSTFNWLLKAFFISWFTRINPKQKVAVILGWRKDSSAATMVELSR